jgi:hypothetical protein
MKGGMFENPIVKFELNSCSCGNQPHIVWHWIKGVANHVNYFIKCDNCKIRTRDRKNFKGAVDDWNEGYLGQ